MKIISTSRKNILEIAHLMLEELRKPPFNEKVSVDAVLKSLNFYFTIGKMYLAVDKGNIIGVLVFKIEQYWEGKVIIIEDLVIKKKYQNKNMEKYFINKLEIYGEKNNIKAIHFTTNKKPKTINIYKKYGYKVNNGLICIEKRLR